MTKDPICGKEVDPLRARAVGIFGGVTYYFCSPECKARFVDPRQKPRAAPRPNPFDPPPPVVESPDDAAERAFHAAAEVEAGEDHAAPLPEPTPTRPRVAPSPSVEADLRAARSGSGRWTVLILLLAALVAAAVVLSFRK